MIQAQSIGRAITRPFRVTAAYVRGSVEELKKVTWPSREQATQYTMIVVISVLVVTGITAFLDYGLSKGLEQLISWSQR